MEYEVRVDEKGRILIPKEVREKLNITNVVKLKVENNMIIIQSKDKYKILDKYAGYFNVNWSEFTQDVDELLNEAIDERSKKWLKDIST
ncbi:AbrB/MazE/SpoVT family DNA-binding domain-containing protein [Acidianus manzaensis]|uniref:AbrB family transcriptional regulator n=1 Tax=Acidianus manzaensis TaxID=282676 RepID=A0A1W6K2D9_9CREN|nr:AbrB/MazE/SpoVT family DNA-binding domain-containing protein [Acidianus manzaensis]ARM76686.1 AbrB family transcriptional regulator [Acidianus manzaensis]